MGFLSMIPLKGWLYLAVGLLILGLGIAVKVQTARLDAEKAEFSAFRVQVEALGREAELRAKTAELADRKAKEKADEQNRKARGDIAILTKRLRDARAAGGYLPAAASGAPSP